MTPSVRMGGLAKLFGRPVSVPFSEVARGLLGLPVALLDLAEDCQAIASTLTCVGCPQCVFAVPTLIDSVIVGKSLEPARNSSSRIVKIPISMIG